MTHAVAVIKSLPQASIEVKVIKAIKLRKVSNAYYDYEGGKVSAVLDFITTDQLASRRSFIIFEGNRVKAKFFSFVVSSTYVTLQEERLRFSACVSS